MKHLVSDCEKRLQALPNFDRHRCQPKEFLCACGRHWVHVCDEADGCFYTQRVEIVHLPRLMSQEFCISTSEARRCLAMGGVRLDGTVVRELDVPRTDLRGKILRLGKRREVQL